jgi:hypothetical protein
MPHAPTPLTRFRSTSSQSTHPSPPLPTRAHAVRRSSPARRTKTPTPRPPPTRTACPTAASQPLPALPPRLGLHPGCCTPASDTPAGASPPASASATSRASSGIPDTKRTPTQMPRAVTHLLRAATPTPVLLRALTPSAACPPRPDTDQLVNSISHCW